MKQCRFPFLSLVCSRVAAALCGCSQAPSDQIAPSVGGSVSAQLSQSFSWQGLSLRYPSDYIITDQEYDGKTYDFCCEIDGNDTSRCHFNIHKDKAWKAFPRVLSDGELINILKKGIESSCDSLRNIDVYSELHFGRIESTTSGPYPSVTCAFSAKLLGISLSGKTIALVGGDKMVSVMLVAETRAHMQTLLAIAESIRLE